jgi:spermidine synthase / saccharopine dehydrogenase (NADP+, L-glutamate-forming)
MNFRELYREPYNITEAQMHKIYSYQEMIAHLPLASHPNPQKVLVIGGGDGGVVREVLKHSTVQQVVLCDIDEAVIRVSKQYLPHMSSLLSDKRVTVYVGDGFAFLKEHTESYDVIITDSSDPVGPAHTLFEKPYFELLRDSLREGGSISTQGEALWLHLPLIKELNTLNRSLFPVTEYAFTTIPTYPSGQIGFIVSTKDPRRDLRTPLRDVPGCRYWNKDVHRSAFTLPEFGRALLEESKLITPTLGKVVPTGAKAKKILLLGSGYVAKPAAEYIVRDPINELTIGKLSSPKCPRYCLAFTSRSIRSVPYPFYSPRAGFRLPSHYCYFPGCLRFRCLGCSGSIS